MDTLVRKSARHIALGALMLTLHLLTACSSSSPPRTTTPTPGLITFKQYPGLGHQSPFFSGELQTKGAAIPAKPGERIDSLTWGFGSGQWGFCSVRIDRTGAVTTVDRHGHEQDPDDYRLQRYRVAPADATALLEGRTLHRCLSLRPYYSAVDISDGSQDFLRIDSDRHVRRFWFSNYSPPALQSLGKELEAWLHRVPATRTARPQRTSAFQVSRDSGISEWLRKLWVRTYERK